MPFIASTIKHLLKLLCLTCVLLQPSSQAFAEGNDQPYDQNGLYRLQQSTMNHNLTPNERTAAVKALKSISDLSYAQNIGTVEDIFLKLYSYTGAQNDTSLASKNIPTYDLVRPPILIPHDNHLQDAAVPAIQSLLHEWIKRGFIDLQIIENALRDESTEHSRLLPLTQKLIRSAISHLSYRYNNDLFAFTAVNILEFVNSDAYRDALAKTTTAAEKVSLLSLAVRIVLAAPHLGNFSDKVIPIQQKLTADITGPTLVKFLTGKGLIASDTTIKFVYQMTFSEGKVSHPQYLPFFINLLESGLAHKLVFSEKAWQRTADMILHGIAEVFLGADKKLKAKLLGDTVRPQLIALLNKFLSYSHPLTPIHDADADSAKMRLRFWRFLLDAMETNELRSECHRLIAKTRRVALPDSVFTTTVRDSAEFKQLVIESLQIMQNPPEAWPIIAVVGEDGKIIEEVALERKRRADMPMNLQPYKHAQRPAPTPAVQENISATISELEKLPADTWQKTSTQTVTKLLSEIQVGLQKHSARDALEFKNATWTRLAVLADEVEATRMQPSAILKSGTQTAGQFLVALIIAEIASRIDNDDFAFDNFLAFLGQLPSSLLHLAVFAGSSAVGAASFDLIDSLTTRLQLLSHKNPNVQRLMLKRLGMHPKHSLPATFLRHQIGFFVGVAISRLLFGGYDENYWQAVITEFASFLGAQIVVKGTSRVIIGGGSQMLMQLKRGGKIAWKALSFTPQGGWLRALLTTLELSAELYLVQMYIAPSLTGAWQLGQLQADIEWQMGSRMQMLAEQLQATDDEASQGKLPTTTLATILQLRMAIDAHFAMINGFDLMQNIEKLRIKRERIDGNSPLSLALTPQIRVVRRTQGPLAQSYQDAHKKLWDEMRKIAQLNQQSLISTTGDSTLKLAQQLRQAQEQSQIRAPSLSAVTDETVLFMARAEVKDFPAFVEHRFANYSPDNRLQAAITILRLETKGKLDQPGMWESQSPLSPGELFQGLLLWTRNLYYFDVAKTEATQSARTLWSTTLARLLASWDQRLSRESQHEEIEQTWRRPPLETMLLLDHGLFHQEGYIGLDGSFAELESHYLSAGNPLLLQFRNYLRPQPTSEVNLAQPMPLATKPLSLGHQPLDWPVGSDAIGTMDGDVLNHELYQLFQKTRALILPDGDYTMDEIIDTTVLPWLLEEAMQLALADLGQTENHSASGESLANWLYANKQSETWQQELESWAKRLDIADVTVEPTTPRSALLTLSNSDIYADAYVLQVFRIGKGYVSLGDRLYVKLQTTIAIPQENVEYLKERVLELLDRAATN